MLTIFTTFKPFSSRLITTIQHNALQSWLALKPQPQVIVFGNDPGVKEIAKQYSITHVPDVKTKRHLPLISSLFLQAQQLAQFPLLCYTNGDIIFMDDFVVAAKQLSTEYNQFLAVGRRYDLTVSKKLAFSKNWQDRLKARVAKQASLHGYSGIDYFLFSRGVYQHIPPLVVGRGGWDNWMIYSTRKRGIPVIDITQVTTVVHQEHDAPQTREQAGRFHDTLAQENLALAGGLTNLLTIRDASYLLTKNGLKRNLKATLSMFYPIQLLFAAKRRLHHLWQH